MELNYTYDMPQAVVDTLAAGRVQTRQAQGHQSYTSIVTLQVLAAAAADLIRLRR